MPTVRHAPEADRYELVEDGAVIGTADYRARGEVLVFPHTEISPTRRGEGLGEVLVRGALDDARRQGRRIVPACRFVADFVATNPEYQDLLAA
jgi:uncharacterized protein